MRFSIIKICFIINFVPLKWIKFQHIHRAYMLRNVKQHELIPKFWLYANYFLIFCYTNLIKGVTEFVYSNKFT